MKHLFIALLALASFNASAQIGVDAIAKQRARDLANQSRNQSMQPPGTAPASRPAAPAASSTPLTPGQQAYATFQSQLFEVKTNASPQVKTALEHDLANVAQGAKKPSPSTISSLNGHLVTALGESKLSTAQKTRLAQEIATLVNTAAGQTQKMAMVEDVPKILQSGGCPNMDALQVGSDLQIVVDEVR